MKQLLWAVLVLSVVGVPLSTGATTISLGELEITANFTLNGAYDFNQPMPQIYGTFSLPTVTAVSGIFATNIANGDTFVMNDLNVHSGPVLPGQIVWTLGDFTFNTTHMQFAGPANSSVLGHFDLTINGVDVFHNSSTLNGVDVGNLGYWDFEAPHDVFFQGPLTQLVTLSIHEQFVDNRPVPEPATWLLLAAAVIVVVSCKRKEMMGN